MSSPEPRKCGEGTPQEVIDSVYAYHQVKGWSMPRIVCAANRFTFINEQGQLETQIVAGARHCDSVMNPIRMRLIGQSNWISDKRTPGLLLPTASPDGFVGEDQGFIDQHGRFYTREEAFIIATDQNQFMREGDWTKDGRLYSEHLY